MIDVRIENLFHKHCYGIWFLSRNRDEYKVAKPMTLEFSEPQRDGFMLPEPSLEINKDQFIEVLQGIVNEAARHGITPKTDKIAGVCEAQREHIKSLEKICERAVK